MTLNKISVSLTLVLYCAAASVFAGGAQPINRPDIIPEPVEDIYREGEFIFSAKTRFDAGEKLAGYLDLRLNSMAVGDDSYAPYNTITVRVDAESTLPPEGYALTVSPDGITITAKDYAGAVYGIETLAQIATSQRLGTKNPTIAIGCREIVDYPRFAYRGMHLDVARTFSDKQTVMRFIDNMARHKFNRLHWHLVDDEGWRIEIESYPRLTSVGAFRGGGLPVKHVYGEWDKRYGGFFTQDDIREVVGYAAARGIVIIPEIDLPGHSRAAAKAYPGILCAGPRDTIPSRGDNRNVWCASKESNFAMLDAILGEVAALFPSEYIHIGGDEVDPVQWESCPDCGPVVRQHSPDYLNGMFMNRLNGILAKHGRKQAVWNEAANAGNLDKEAVVYGWENVEACRKSLKAGYKTVIMPAQYFYLDMRQNDGEPGMTWAGTVTLEKIYSFEPAAAGISASEMKNVLGMEGAFWTEKLLEHTPAYLDYQTYPRMCALSELLWTPQESRDWGDFNARLTRWHFPRLAEWGIAFRIDPPVETREGGVIVITPPFAGARIRYTTDGTEPGETSQTVGELRIAASDAAGKVYRLKACYGPATSRTVYLNDHKENVLTPEYSLISSMKSAAGYPLANAADNKPRTAARTTATCTRGDWFEWRFAKPLDAAEITISTGANHMARWVVPSGRIEVSYDGTTFEPVDPEFHVRSTIRPRPGLRAIRLTVASEDNGDDYVIIQDLKITG